MEYINTNYISLEDLDDLDSKIASLGEQKNALAQQIHAKCSGGNLNSGSHPEASAPIKWLSPKEKVTIDSETFKQISKLFSDLIELQASVGVPSYPDVWWGLDTLVSPFVVRFNFHFRESAETNKLTKPEWALSYVEEFLGETLPTLEFIVADTFYKHGRIGVFEIISAVLVPVRDKLNQMLAIINQNIAASVEDEKTTDQFGRLLSHLIFEATSFDQRLRNTYKYNPFVESVEVAPEKKWMGLTGDILISNEKENVSVNNWLSLELRLAKKRFDTEIIAPKNAFDIDYEFTASSEAPDSIVKPTYSAYGLAKLFDNLTSHFKTINIVKYQLKYVSQIQLVFLEQYLEQLQKQFRQFNDSLGSKLISSFLPSSTKSEATSSTQTAVTNGLTGLEMLTGIYCSTKFIVERMEEWSENLIYIQLWNYCQSSSGAAGDSIFDSSIDEYKTLLSKVASKYEDFFRKEVRGALKDYVNASNWNIEDPHYKVQVSSSLSGFTTTIPAYASYLKRALPEIDYFIISNKICDSYAYILLEYVITNNQFNKRGLEQLQADIDYLYGVLKGDLMLDHSHKYSNAENKSYKRVTQSIEMMNRFDAAGAKMLKKQFQNGEAIAGGDVSSKHCQFAISNNNGKEYLLLTDTSTNGTSVNGEVLGKGITALLRSGDKISFAKSSTYIFRYVADESGTAKKRSFFDDYILQNQLGTGHYAVVKEARDRTTGDIVAVKIFHPNKTKSNGNGNGGENADGGEEAKLRQEMNLLLSTNHPNIVRFISHYVEPINEFSSTTYLVLEKVNSGELFQRIINKSKLGQAETKAIYKQLLSGLHYLHAKNIIHRDIKPENILLDIEPRIAGHQKQTGPWDEHELDVKVKIADFGLAKFIGELKFTNTLCGTPAYVAPEVLNNNRNYSTKVDIWSAGVLLYVCLCGFPPFSDELGPPSMREQILEGKYAFYSPYWDDIEDSALDLISNLLLVDPSQRYDVNQSCQHFWFNDAEDDASQDMSSSMGVEALQRQPSTIEPTTLKQRFTSELNFQE
ncbi:hypothetical protein JCM33374_g934 [Metschnikowia sp. JCM 33374]|nr:hypothetical protein JCM33374_g934 [Metschnikowia sp. JCM 33374]